MEQRGCERTGKRLRDRNRERDRKNERKIYIDLVVLTSSI